MKRVISFILVLSLLAPFGISGALAADVGWEIDHYVDDFGDPTDDAYLRDETSGSFSSAESLNVPLTVIVCYDWDCTAFFFRLLKDGGLPATDAADKAEDAVFKIKTADGAISEGELGWGESAGELYLACDLPVAARMMDALRQEEAVRCVIMIGGTKVNFTVDGAGFPDCLAELEEIKCAPVYADAEALLAAEDYDGAIAAFRTLGDYKDSAEQLSIAQAARAAQAAEAMQAVLPADSYEDLGVEDDGEINFVYAAEGGGWVVQVTEDGSQGAITMLVGVDPDLTCSGISVTESSETAGLGAIAAQPSTAGNAFRAQFVGQSGTVAIAKDGGTINALTGATITSRAISAGVTAALAFCETLAG